MLERGCGFPDAENEWNRRINAVLNNDLNLHNDEYFIIWLNRQISDSSEKGYQEYIKSLIGTVCAKI